MKIKTLNGIEKELATKEYIDSKNELIFDMSVNGSYRPTEQYINEKLKNCKSVLITLIKMSNYNFTFEITTDTQFVNMNGNIVYFTLDKANGLIKTTGTFTNDIYYKTMYVRR